MEMMFCNIQLWLQQSEISTGIGGAENDEHENDGPSKCPGMNIHSWNRRSKRL